MNAASTIRELIDARAAAHPDKPYLIALDEEGGHAGGPGSPDGETILTYGQLRDDCRALQASLREEGPAARGCGLCLHGQLRRRRAPAAGRHV